MPGVAGGQTASTLALWVPAERATEGAVPKNGAATATRTTAAAIRRVPPENLTISDPSTVCRNHTDRLGPPAARQENPRHTWNAQQCYSRQGRPGIAPSRPPRLWRVTLSDWCSYGRPRRDGPRCCRDGSPPTVPDIQVRSRHNDLSVTLIASGASQLRREVPGDIKDHMRGGREPPDYGVK